MTTHSRTRLALLKRAEVAVMALYHAATPAYPDDFGPYASGFEDWLAGEAEQAIQHVNDGGVYGNDYAATLAHPANAGRFKSEAARRIYTRSRLSARRLDLEKGGAVDETRELFGELYTWGRGGRTVAPEGIVRQRGGGSFSLTAEPLGDWSAEALTRAVRVLEALGAEVTRWNKGVPAMWAEYTRNRADEESALAKARADESRTVITVLLGDLRKIRREGLAVPGVCDAMRRVIRQELGSWRASRAKVASLAGVLA